MGHELKILPGPLQEKFTDPWLISTCLIFIFFRSVLPNNEMNPLLGTEYTPQLLELNEDLDHLVDIGLYTQRNAGIPEEFIYTPKD